MIGRLRGRLLTQEADRILIETSAGVGYEVIVAPRALVDLPAQGEETTLHVHTQVREDAITLYGFLQASDRAAFRLVQSVSGIGPKLALAIIGTCEPTALATAIAREDTVALCRIPGLGKKTAARLCLELKDKLDRLLGQDGAGLPSLTDIGGSGGASPAVGDASAALEALGYSSREIAKAIKNANPTDDDTVQSLLRRALKSLSPA
ncbi:MAG TPA: Holliday junction branch migration protein RuvA [Deltaproteobacteria bacterium]|nr:Holliday junction branch migration protein RuvA [Deltaproteobacteria bacterium]HCP45278.1 Holliday junction branch migration protein RuvA [Deltaproteobacteria bacterium]